MDKVVLKQFFPKYLGLLCLLLCAMSDISVGKEINWKNNEVTRKETKKLGIRKILITFYSLIPTVFLYVKVTRVRLLPACLSVRKQQRQKC